MTLPVEVFWSFRSPYSYLATPRLAEIAAAYDVDLQIRPVYPLAVRVDGFFERQDPRWPMYVVRDCFRTAQMLGMPFGPPRPDPIVMNMATREIAKDQPYIDVLCEAINNPLRMLAGWFIVTSATMAPASLLLSYWMIGCYFMALKRYAELASLAGRSQAGAYRRSFSWYTADRLIVAIMFYASSSMLFFGAFCMRYRLELVLAFPLVALVMAMYLRVALKPNSAAQQPEQL